MSKKINSIVDNKNGRILKLSTDIFEEHYLECENGHNFQLFENDILMGKWCNKCKNKIEEILENLSINYKIGEKIGDYHYDYVVSGKRNFVFFSNETKRSDMIENAFKNNFNIIITENLEEEDLEKKIWESIKENKKITEFLRKKKKREEKVTHNCTRILNLGNEKDDTGSIIKYALEPYPKNIRKIIGYIRVSTAMQVQDGFSLEAQENKIFLESNKMKDF